MTDAAIGLLRELVKSSGDSPYQALDKTGPFACVFCGALTENELRPEHEAECPWPRVLAAVGFEPEDRSLHETPPARKPNRPANER